MFKKNFPYCRELFLFAGILLISAKAEGAPHRLSAQSAFLSEKTWRFDFSGGFLNRQTDEKLFSFPELGVTYSVVKQVELSVFWPFLILDRANQSAVAGAGDLDLSTKVALHRRKCWAAAVHFGVKLPNAKDEKWLGTDQTDFYTSALLSERTGAWEFSQNFGFGILGSPTALRNQEDVYMFAFSTDYRPGKFRFSGEWFGQASPHPSYVFSHLAAGISYQIAETILQLSCLKSLTERPKGYQNVLGADWGVTIGLQRHFK